MKKLLKIFLSFVVVQIVVATSQTTFAQTYGGNTPPTTCLTIDQTVSNPAIMQTIEYVDNISPSDVKYQPNGIIIARIRVKNVSSIVVPAVTITNTIPSYVNYFAGPGTLSADGRILAISLGDMQPGEERYAYVTYKVVGADALPSDRSIVCVLNKVAVQGSTCNRDEDSAQLCIEKRGSGGTTTISPDYIQQLNAVKTAPKAGPELGLALISFNGIAATVGYFIKKRSN